MILGRITGNVVSTIQRPPCSSQNSSNSAFVDFS